MIDWLNSNANAVTAFSAGVTAFATGALAVLTWILAQENRKLRKAGTEPKVVAYLTTHPVGHNVINFVLANIGQGPALDVWFELIYDEEDFKAYGVRLQNNPERTAISALPQGEKIIAWFGMGHDLAGARDQNKNWLKPFAVTTTYKDLDGKVRRETQSLDLSQFKGINWISATAPEYRIAEAIEKIEKKMMDSFAQHDIREAMCSISKALSPKEEDDVLSCDQKESKSA